MLRAFVVVFGLMFACFDLCLVWDIKFCVIDALRLTFVVSLIMVFDLLCICCIYLLCLLCGVRCCATAFACLNFIGLPVYFVVLVGVGLLDCLAFDSLSGFVLLFVFLDLDVCFAFSVFMLTWSCFVV